MKAMIRADRASFLVLTAALLAIPGCHSAFIQATVVNASGKTVHLLEVDYPSASFGSGELPPGGQFHYRFKVVGEGPLKVIWTGGDEREHTQQGPVLNEGSEGRLTVTIRPAAAEWDLHLRKQQ